VYRASGRLFGNGDGAPDDPSEMIGEGVGDIGGIPGIAGIGESIGRPVISPVIRDRQLGEPFDLPAVEMVLVDRLRSPTVAQLGRSICGEQQQRDAALASLDDRGPEVRDRRARGRQDGNRPTGRAGNAERKVGRGSLVDEDEQADLVVGRKG